MLYFTAPQLVSIDAAIIQKAKLFAEQVTPTVGTAGSGYRDTNQTNLSKIRYDHYVSKVGEEAVKSVMEQFGKEVVGPDYEIYQGRQKSWKSDLKVEGVNLAVKTQSLENAHRYGESWTFQSGGYRYDPILQQPEAWICFVLYDETNRICKVYPPYQIKDLEFGEPIRPELKGFKKVVYAERLPKIW